MAGAKRGAIEQQDCSGLEGQCKRRAHLAAPPGCKRRSIDQDSEQVLWRSPVPLHRACGFACSSTDSLLQGDMSQSQESQDCAGPATLQESPQGGLHQRLQNLTFGPSPSLRCNPVFGMASSNRSAQPVRQPFVAGPATPAPPRVPEIQPAPAEDITATPNCTAIVTPLVAQHTDGNGSCDHATNTDYGTPARRCSALTTSLRSYPATSATPTTTQPARTTPRPAAARALSPALEAGSAGSLDAWLPPLGSTERGSGARGLRGGVNGWPGQHTPTYTGGGSRPSPLRLHACGALAAEPAGPPIDTTVTNNTDTQHTTDAYPPHVPTTLTASVHEHVAQQHGGQVAPMCGPTVTMAACSEGGMTQQNGVTVAAPLGGGVGGSHSGPAVTASAAGCVCAAGGAMCAEGAACPMAPVCATSVHRAAQRQFSDSYLASVRGPVPPHSAAEAHTRSVSFDRCLELLRPQAQEDIMPQYGSEMMLEK